MVRRCCWIYPEKRELSKELIDAAGSKVLAQLLLNRGIDTAEKTREFLNPENVELKSPYVFEHMEKAVDRVNKAIERQEHIVVYGDFDSDGVTSTALLYKTLKHLGANFSYYIPDRTDEGHGLNSPSLIKIISSKKAKLIITVDCGINNITEIALAKGLGTDIIVTDHHEPGEIIPPAYAIINPKAQADTGLEYLAGVGVAYKLALALLEFNGKEDFADDILYLVAFGSIADVVPLIGENRAYVKRGLDLIFKKRPEGLVKLLDSTGYSFENGVTSEMIAFGVAPRINAVGRLAEASLAVELLVSEDSEEIELIVKKLNYNNRTRQQMCESTFIEACQKINAEIDVENSSAIILADNNWHPGIIGIVASKIAEKYFKPAFLVSINEENKEGRCSARGVEGVHLYETLTTLSDYFKRYGGHAQAAGFNLDLTRVGFEEFRTLLDSAVAANLGGRKPEPFLKIDMDLNSEDVTIDFISEIEKLAPFGESNPSPVFSISNLALKQYKTMGQSKNHLKVFLSDGERIQLEAVWWQRNTLEFSLLDTVNVAFTPEINSFAGKTSVQLTLKDMQGCSTPKEEKHVEIVQKPEDKALKWIDHRKRAEVEKVFSNYLKTSKSNAIVFAESSEAIEIVKNNPILNDIAVDRLNVRTADQLILLDLPPDPKVLSEIIERSNVKIVHLVENNRISTDPNQMIKTVSGMLKYAHSNMNGEVGLNQLAVKLFTSGMVIKSCLKLLYKANIISILDKSGDNIRFKFLGSADFSAIKNLEEYRMLVESVKVTEDFRQSLATGEINEIKEQFDKFSKELVKNS